MLPLVEKERASALYDHLNVRWRALQSTLTLQRDSGTLQLHSNADVTLHSLQILLACLPEAISATLIALDPTRINNFCNNFLRYSS